MTQKLSQTSKDIRDRFVAHLALRYVVDESGTYPKVISASGRTQNLSSLTFEFPQWAKDNGLRVPEDQYSQFMSSLEVAIRGRLNRVCGISFKPVETRSFVDSKGDRLLNTYLPFHPERPANYIEAKAILDDFASRLFHQNSDDMKHVLQFFGHVVQRPDQRPQHGLVMRGTSGCGKSTLIDLLKVGLGGRYVWSENDYAPVFSQFSEVLPNNLMVCFDDATASKNTYEDLKLAVTRTVANVQIKGVQHVLEREVYSRVCILSNSQRPFIMREDDRRFYVTEFLTHLHDPSESEDYFVRFTEFWKNQANAAAIHWWFRDIDLTGFTPHACVKTEARKQLIAMSTSGLDAAISEFLGGKEVSYIDAHGATQTETPPVQAIFHEKQVLAFLQDKGITDIPADMLRRKLTEANYQTARRIVGNLNGGKQIEVWQKITPGQRRAPSLTAEQVEAITYAYTGTF